MCILNIVLNYVCYKKVNMLSKYIIMQVMKWVVYYRYYDKLVVLNIYIYLF